MHAACLTRESSDFFRPPDFNEWYETCRHRDGIRLRPSRRMEMSLDHDGNVELRVTNACYHDAGVYTCTAVNEVGRAESSARVLIMRHEFSEPPSISVTEL
jgi:Immunoglobulin I-set domain